MERAMRCLLAFIVVFAIIIGGFVAYLYSGSFDIAATQDNPGWVDWMVVTARRHSIQARVGDIQVPDNLDNQQMIATGAKHYAAMCAGCHLAPGKDDSEIRAGLNPRPPALPKIAKYIKPNVAYWAIKNGIRMTGMPAWGPTHSEQKLWAIVAFVKALPGMSPERYQMLTAGAKEEHHHAHQAGPSQAPAPQPRSGGAPRGTTLPGGG
jgi:mono/diheme cytochrome c family protein